MEAQTDMSNFDKFEYIQRLRTAGVEEPLATAHADALHGAL